MVISAKKCVFFWLWKTSKQFLTEEGGQKPQLLKNMHLNMHLSKVIFLIKQIYPTLLFFIASSQYDSKDG